MSITVVHYGPLRDQRGVAREVLAEVPATAQDLYRRLGFTLAIASVAVAVNDDLVPWEHPLRPGDTVVFLPPVSGG